jgi:transposase InsO family protein
MVKLKSKKKLIWAFKQFKKQKKTQKELCFYLKISRQWFSRLYKIWNNTQEIPIKQVKLGRPKRKITLKERQIILQEYNFARNALYLESIIYAKHKLRIPHNHIHMILRKEGLSKREPNKSRRRKPWVRYERNHSLSAGHIDWHYNTKLNKHVCVVIDDSSRMILAYGEFNNATTENSIKLVQDVIDKFAHIRVIREIISDHGAQFCANKKDSKGKAKHTFTEFLKSKGIKQILCRVKHPQSNGKVEKWFDFYEKNRYNFQNIDELIKWYNEERVHGSLNLRKAETPKMAFYNRLPEEYFYSLAVKFLKL